MSPRTLATSAAVVALVAVAAWLLLLRPIPPEPVRTAPSGTSGSTTLALPGSSRPPSSERPVSRRSATESTCRPGQPARLVIPSLGVDAAFEEIGLDQEAEPDDQGRQPLGNPKDRTKAGWYHDGPRPGDGRGTVLTNGHTYRNNSAIFKEDFSSRIHTGQVIHVEQDNGSRCSYRVARVWRDVDAATDYPRIIRSEHLYNFDGPERLFLTTCSGSWNSVAQDYNEISLLIATPVDRD